METEIGMSVEKMLSQQQVAQILGVSTKTLEYWRWKKKGPKFLKIGRLARYRESDIIAYIQSLVRQEVEGK